MLGVKFHGLTSQVMDCQVQHYKFAQTTLARAHQTCHTRAL